VSTYRRLRAHLLATRASWCRTDAALNLNTRRFTRMYCINLYDF